MREISLEELSENNGKEGKPVYVAYGGKVYDVSQSKLWKTGVHMKRHHSGQELTTDLSAAPHGPDVLERFPQVGIIKSEVPSSAPSFLEPIFQRFPFLRRHPHPMTVHFPITFLLSATFFTVLFLLTGRPSFDSTAFNCLTAGMMFTPIVMLTGFISWWVNYLAKPIRAVYVKMIVSVLLFADSFILFTWRIMVPDLMGNFNGWSLIYLLLILALSPMVVVIGWYGAKLTFPLERE